MPSDDSMQEALKKVYYNMVNKTKDALGDQEEDEQKIGQNVAKNIDMDKYKAFKKGFNY